MRKNAVWLIFSRGINGIGANNIATSAIFVIFLVLIGCFSNTWQKPAVEPLQKILLLPMASVPLANAEKLASSAAILNKITAKSYLVLDLDSGAKLIEKNSNVPMYPASTVKMLTALVGEKMLDISKSVVVSEALDEVGNSADNTINSNKSADTTNEAAPFFNIGEQVTIADLIASSLIQSDNFAADTLANKYPGGRSQFINEMNRFAQSLHATSSTFVNPVGYDDNRQQTTAWDLSLIARELLQHERLRDLVASKQKVITSFNGTQHIINNTNQLLGKDPAVKGLKTGTTPLAGEVLISYWEKDGHRLMAVVMGSRNRYADTNTLINSTLDIYNWQEITLVP